MKKYSIFLCLMLTVFNTACGDNTSTNKTVNTVDHSEQNFKWKMVTSWPKNFPGLGVGAENIAKIINQLSN